MNVNATRTRQKIQLKPLEVREMVRASEELLSLVEDVLERSNAYQPEFLKGLKASQKQAKSKNVRKVSSLKDL